MTGVSLSVERLLAAGYLPEVLPPCFSSSSFGDAFTSAKSPPADFVSSGTVPKDSRCARYNQARVGGTRRQFSLPNPVHYFRLANCFYSNWAAIEAQARKSPFSLTKPVLSGGKRSFRPEVDFRDRPIHRARVRSTARVILRTDISRFFPSVYTHSIPWAFHTKAVAKANYDHTLFGNELDYHLRNLQDKQTIGIPIGQDISRVFAEAILSRVEESIQPRKRLVGIRCIDDYEIGFIDAGSAQSFLSKLQQALADYELALNPHKTAIFSLPQLLIDRWDSELRRIKLGYQGTGLDDDDDFISPVPDLLEAQPKKDQLLLFFNKAIELQTEFRDEAVLRFSLKRAAHLRMTTDCWPLYQDYLFHCALNQPETLRLVISNLLKAVYLDEMPLDRRKLKFVLDTIIQSAAPVGHTSDVAWALWVALLLRIRLSPASSAQVESFQDSVVGCLSCAAREKNLMAKGFKPSWINTLLKSAGAFYGEHWLIAYEAVRNGWVKKPPTLDSCFGYLCQENVGFFAERHADEVRKELRLFNRTSKRPPEDNEDDSDSEDAFDNWWFHDDLD